VLLQCFAVAARSLTQPCIGTAHHSTWSLVRTLLDDNACRAAALRASPPLAVPHRVLDADVAGGSGTGTPVTAGSGSRDGIGGAFDSAYACWAPRIQTC